MSDYLTTQIITYMGNKRKLLSKIEEIIVSLEKENGRKLTMGDGFSGSGVVSRLFKGHASKLYSNDIADYSETLNKAFLSNVSEEDLKKIRKYVNTANKHADNLTEKYASTIQRSLPAFEFEWLQGSHKSTRERRREW